MIEAEARRWIVSNFGASRETLLAQFAELVVQENERQNLVAPSTIPQLWERHIVDSAQLALIGAEASGPWLDIGTGGGFPGMVIACLCDQAMTLCEPRRRRAEFLQAAAKRLSLGGRVEIVQKRVEMLTEERPYAVVSARAVASLPSLFDSASHLTNRETLWLLPKGKTAREEVAVARRTWHGTFHVEQSFTQSDSLIVVARGVARK